MHDVQHISVYIARRPAEVYEFASDPRNLPRWAAGLARSEVRRDGDEWIADAPFGGDPPTYPTLTRPSRIGS